jgi:hypothetical protein
MRAHVKMAIEDKGSAVKNTGSCIDEDRLALLALALTPNLGPKRIVDAMRELRCPAQLFALTLTELEGLRFPADAAQFIFDGKARRVAEDEAERFSKNGIKLVTLASADYPVRLKEIYDPPPVFWVRAMWSCSRKHPLRLWAHGISRRMGCRWRDACARSGYAAAGNCERDGAGN